MKIIFMGTPEFAIPSLEALYKSYDLVSVVTAPDKPAGRGHNMNQSPVKKYCLIKDIPFLQPTNLKSKSFLNQIEILQADISVIVAFRMLPEILLNIPKYGSINLHASLLPNYRGAAPIQRAIMNGESKSGLTVFKLARQIDTGDIIDSVELSISEDETGGSLHDKMAAKGAHLLLKSLNQIETNTVHFKTQNSILSSLAPKIFSEDCRIDWNQSVDLIYNQIRALIPYPCSWFDYNGKIMKIHKANKIKEEHNYKSGEWLIESGKLKIACLDGYIQIIEIQPEGKQKMEINAYLNGIQKR